jgi:hypothetical protein
MERTKLIDAIVKYSGGELSEFTNDDFISLAKESNDQLLDRLIGILEWYENEVQELNKAITQ